MSDREFLHMTPSFRSIEPSQTVHYWPWSRTSTSCLAVHCRSCTSSSAVQLKYTLTVYQRPSRLRDYLACTHANTSTVKYGGPASHPRKSQAARNRGAVPASGRPQWSQALHILYYLHTHTLMDIIYHIADFQKNILIVLTAFPLELKNKWYLIWKPL